MAKFEVGDYFRLDVCLEIYQIGAVNIAHGEISYQVIGHSGWYHDDDNWIKLSPQEVAHIYAEQICEGTL